MIEAGSVFFTFSLATGFTAFFAAIWGYIKQDHTAAMIARQAVTLHFIVLGLAELILLYLLVAGDFSVEYVYGYVNRALPLFYRGTALWAGHAGSLLFWNFLISFFGFLAVRHIEKEEPVLLLPMIFIIMGVSLFFSLVGNFNESSDPFKHIVAGGEPYYVPDGKGLNPLLQHWAMVIHPPTLLMGFAAFTIPFAIAMSSLITNRINLNWTRLVRRWTLFSWALLGAGMMLGGKWAYEELGWGGYWFWDAVENSSLMPWLASTAFLHSILVQEKREMFKVWNMILVSVSFALCIFGTFITRSGLIQSVHAFSNNGLGAVFFIFLVTIILFSAYWILYRLKVLRSDRPINSYLSREAGFLFNNMLLIFMVSVVLLGTVWSWFSELAFGVADQKTEIWFNNRMVPLGLLLLFLTGSGPLLSWRKTSGKTLLRNFRFPLSILLTTLAGYLAYRYFLLPKAELKALAGLSFSLSAFIIAGTLEEFYRTAMARIRITKESFLLGFVMIFFQNKRRFMGYAIHMGLAFMFIGFTGKAFNQEIKMKLRPLETEYYNGYTVRLDKFEEYASEVEGKEVPLFYSSAAYVSVFKGEKLVGSDVTEMRTYPMYNPARGQYQGQQPTSEPGIIHDGFSDVYFQLGGAEDGRFTIQVRINPLVQFVWFGIMFYHVFLIFLLLPIGEGKTVVLFGKRQSVNPVSAD